MTFVVAGENFTTAQTELIQEMVAAEGSANFVPKDQADQIWILIAGFLVFFMHAGFSMLEAGSVRAKNAVNIMFKNVMTLCIGAVSYFLIGWGLAYGPNGGGFIASGDFALSETDNTGNHGWFFQFAFCATAATIVSGALAGRVVLGGYFIVACVMTIWIYPVVSHWVWGNGFLSAFVDPSDRPGFLGSTDASGFVDYAGSGVVHMTGGVAALVGAKILGPRLGRFQKLESGAYGEPLPMPGHSMTLSTLGVFILWVGWYGFNCGSTLAFDGPIASKVAVTTTLSPATAALTGMLFGKFVKGHWDLVNTLNCVLAGLVSITAPCSVVADGYAILIGFFGAFVYMGGSALVLKLHIDDPLDAGAVHGITGIWGCLAVGLFADDVSLQDAGFAGMTSKGTQFGIQVVGVLCIFSWVVANSLVLFLTLKVLGLLRVSADVEEAGLDASEHGGAAYELDEVTKA
mmetsp:Transcript_40532/g.82843  ORF Transcript_40532/g.82843 Transcript_40532/m.82843 type:complete len:460 (+) Transcript_40532:82-1461(+)|eukprot:CAMPEP_0181300916 /NCGR_PEP_ID=MMETSP1101-20121128/7146_1 /TAXON_ID=46948 /ORGANISM="Rhodomonas abbreviata, Strain Caron Lab Isolate" /LENGTH=459 /DNA_ID=CAMNT_0023406187 /DNA_START=82 /DNA_END=1461 /DNA_ORIENTATION=-